MANDMWEELLDLIKDTPYQWAIYFDPDLHVILEHFSEDYGGAREQGSGDWEVTGTLDEVTRKCALMLKGEHK